MISSFIIPFTDIYFNIIFYQPSQSPFLESLYILVNSFSVTFFASSLLLLLTYFEIIRLITNKTQHFVCFTIIIIMINAIWMCFITYNILVDMSRYMGLYPVGVRLVCLVVFCFLE